MPVACAFQMEAVHEDLMGGMLRALREIGYDVHAFVNERVRASRGDFFDTVKLDDVRISYSKMDGRAAWDALASEVKRAQPSVVFFNTFQRDGIARWAEGFGVPILGVVHNPFLFRESEACVELAGRGRVEAFGLAPHVVRTLEAEVAPLRGRTHLYLPYEWMPSGSDEYQTPRDLVRIVIPGAVDYSNRAFEPMIDHLRRADLHHVRDHQFIIAAGGPDRQRLEGEVADAGLSNQFEFLALDGTTGRVPHSEYLRALYRSHAVLPLLPVDRKDYLTSKITTGIAAAIGTGRPIIAPASVGAAYGVRPLETPEARPFDLTDVDLTDQKLEERRREALELRSDSVIHNRRVIECVAPTS